MIREGGAGPKRGAAPRHPIDMTHVLPTSPLVLVTGATDGIGRETALQLARRGARVLLHGRNPGRLREVRAAVEEAGGRAVPEPVRADLGSMAEVRALAAELDRRAEAGEAIDVLLHNAGVFMNEYSRTPDGFEATFAINHLAPFLLTHLVLAGPSGRGLKRVVNVSSIAHTRGKIDLDDLQFERRGFDGYQTYAASKLANVLFTVELARRVASRGVTVNALHPGVVSTKLLTEGFGMRGGDSLEKGAATSVMLAIAPEVAGTTGGYFSDRRPAPMASASRDGGLTRAFFEKSAGLVGVEALAAVG